MSENKEEKKEGKKGKPSPTDIEKKYGQASFSTILEITESWDWKKEYAQIYAPFGNDAPYITDDISKVTNLDFQNRELVSGLYLIWGYKGSGKTTRLISGYPVSGNELPPLVYNLKQNKMIKSGVYLGRMCEPDYGSNQLIAAEFTNVIKGLNSKKDSIMILDSLAGLLNYQMKHSAEEGEIHSWVSVPVSKRYAEEGVALQASNAASTGGVPGSFTHMLRVLQNVAKAQNWIVLGIMNPLRLQKKESEAILIGEINSATNGVLPLDGCVESKDVRVYNREKGCADRIDFAKNPAVGDEELVFTTVSLSSDDKFNL